MTGWLQATGCLLILGITLAACNRGAECAAACECQQRGLCGASWRGECKAKSDEHCQQAEVCKTFGKCTEDDGACIVASDADCGRSEACTKVGRCIVKDGACVR